MDTIGSRRHLLRQLVVRLDSIRISNVVLTRDLESARELASELARDQASTHNRSRAHDFARTCTLDRARNRAEAVAVRLALDETLRLDLDLPNGRNLASAREAARDLSHTVTRAVACEIDLASNVAAALGDARVSAGVFTDVLDQVIHHADALIAAATPAAAPALMKGIVVPVSARPTTTQQAAALTTKLPASAPTAPKPVVVPAPALAATRLLARGVDMLPPAERARYREEFDAELYDLVASGANRRAQVAYTLRVVAHISSLRRALRTPTSSKERTG